MKKLITLSVLMFAFSICKSQTTVNIEPPLDDAFVYQATPSTNYGSSNNLDVGQGPSGELRMLIKWDLSSLPSCINISNAQIRLNQWSNNGNIGADIFRIDGSWSEASVTWNNQPPITGWYGTQTFSSSGGLYFIPATNLVNDWLTFGNNGVMFIISWGSNSQSFESKEASGSDPRLIVTYTTITSSTAPSSASASPDTICSGNSTTLTKSGGTLGTGASWKWYSNNCGSGLVGTGSSISVSPTSTTTYFVRAEGDCNNTSCASVIVIVSSCNLPVANFTASSTSICAGNCINFTDLTSNSPTSWSWTFTNGTPSSSTSQNPSNICYNTQGTYTVTLTATNSNGSDSEIKTSYINVNPLPIAQFSASSTNLSVGDCINFTDQSSGNPTSWSWIFTGANPNTSTLQNPNNICYNTEGVYQVTLNATNSCGSDSETKFSYVNVTVGIEEIDFINNINIFPNPNTGNFVIEMEITKVTDLEIKLLNIIGQIIYEEKVNKYSGVYQKEIDLPNIKSGVYYLDIQTKEGVIRKEISVIR